MRARKLCRKRKPRKMGQSCNPKSVYWRRTKYVQHYRAWSMIPAFTDFENSIDDWVMATMRTRKYATLFSIYLRTRT